MTKLFRNRRDRSLDPGSASRQLRSTSSASDWFKDHPAHSIVIHTFVVAGVVWAAFAFVFDENKVAVYRAQVENEKTIATQYKAKTEILEVEIARLREENRKYLDWMVRTPNTIPHLEERVKQLSDEASRAKVELKAAARSDATGTAALNQAPYSVATLLRVGESLVDQRTGATFGIGPIASNFTATGVIGLPGEKPQDLTQVKAGTYWTFTKDGTKYQLVVSKIDWFSNKAELVLKELETTKSNQPPSGPQREKALTRP